MKRIQAIVENYLEIDAALEGQLRHAASIGDEALVRRIEERQTLNDQAYFILCWGQLEDTISDTCRAAIRKRIAGGEWSARRGWDLYNPDDKRLSGLTFEERTALVLDKRAGKGSPWARVMMHYEIRNKIAHGTLSAGRIDVALVVDEFLKIAGSLQE